MRDAGDKLLPYFDPWGVTLTIDRRYLEIRVDDSIFANYIELLTTIFKQQIADGIEEEVEKILNKNIDRILNARILKRQGQRLPFVRSKTLNYIAFDFTVPYNWTITEDYIYLQWNGAPYDNLTAGADIQGVQETALPWVNPGCNKTIQATLGTYGLNNFVYALLESQPDIYINVGYDTLPIPFDIQTINYVLPGISEYYGWVNKNMSMHLYFEEITVQEYFPEHRNIGIRGSANIELLVVGGNLNGTD
jgi:hypothetical protein